MLRIRLVFFLILYAIVLTGNIFFLEVRLQTVFIPLFALFLAGTLLNSMVVFSNEGMMPSLLTSPNDKGDGRHCAITDNTHLGCLADRFDFKIGVCSIGDMLGIAGYIYYLSAIIFIAS